MTTSPRVYNVFLPPSPRPTFSAHEVCTLLHVYALARPFDDAPATQAALNRFLHAELIQRTTEATSGYSLTDKGETLVQMILHTPMPEVRYCDPRFPTQP